MLYRQNDGCLFDIAVRCDTYPGGRESRLGIKGLYRKQYSFSDDSSIGISLGDLRFQGRDCPMGMQIDFFSEIASRVSLSIQEVNIGIFEETSL